MECSRPTLHDRQESQCCEWPPSEDGWQHDFPTDSGTKLYLWSPWYTLLYTTKARKSWFTATLVSAKRHAACFQLAQIQSKLCGHSHGWCIVQCGRQYTNFTDTHETFRLYVSLFDIKLESLKVDINLISEISKKQNTSSQSWGNNAPLAVGSVCRYLDMHILRALCNLLICIFSGCWALRAAQGSYDRTIEEGSWHTWESRQWALRFARRFL